MSKQNQKRILQVVIVIIWMVVIFGFSSMNSDLSNGASKGIIENIINFTVNSDNHMTSSEIQKAIAICNYPFRKAMHMTEYMIFTIIILCAMRAFDIKGKKQYIIAILCCFAYASTDEFHQMFSNRTSLFTDVLFDTSGGGIGLLVYYLFCKDRQKKNIIENKSNHNIEGEKNAEK